MRRVVFVLVLLALAASATLVEARTARRVCRASCEGLLQNCVTELRRFAEPACKRKWVRACQRGGVAVCSVPQVAGQWTFDGRLFRNPCRLDVPDGGSSSITLSQVGGFLTGTVGVTPVQGFFGGYYPLSAGRPDPSQGWEVYSASGDCDLNGCCTYIHLLVSLFSATATLGLYGNCNGLLCAVGYRGTVMR